MIEPSSVIAPFTLLLYYQDVGTATVTDTARHRHSPRHRHSQPDTARHRHSHSPATTTAPAPELYLKQTLEVILKCNQRLSSLFRS